MTFVIKLVKTEKCTQDVFVKNAASGFSGSAETYHHAPVHGLGVPVIACASCSWPSMSGSVRIRRSCRSQIATSFSGRTPDIIIQSAAASIWKLSSVCLRRQNERHQRVGRQRTQNGAKSEEDGTDASERPRRQAGEQVDV
eukprot:5926765-Pleurochrysis_carterae.AAC.7